MKSKQSTIPLKLRAEMVEDPFYSKCALSGQILNKRKHECKGSVTWEHTLIFAGSKIQEKWSIIPLCEKYHGVNWYQDSGYLVKELNVWVALNRATDAELKAKSKVIDYIKERARLNALYGVYTPVVTLTDPKKQSAQASGKEIEHFIGVYKGFSIVVKVPPDLSGNFVEVEKLQYEIGQKLYGLCEKCENIIIKNTVC